MTSLIEIKPKKQCSEPTRKKRITKSFIKEMLRWEVNQAKWKSATKYASQRGWDFKILTENELLLGNQ